jgi:hypothetical protein
MRLVIGYEGIDQEQEPGAEAPALVSSIQQGSGLGGASPKGQYLIIEIDFEKWNLQITTDPVGSVPVFYTTAGGRRLVSTSLAEIVKMGLDPEVNPDFIINFETIGHTADDATFLKGVHLVPPSRSLQLGDDEFGITSAKYDPTRERNDIKDAQSRVRAFRHEVRQELRRIGALAQGFGANSSAVLMLSGGLDSAVIASNVPDLSRFNAATFDGGPEGELPRAQSIAKEIGLPHTTITVGYTGVSTAGRDLVAALAGLPCPVPALSLWLVRSRGLPGPAYIYGAHGLDGGFLYGMDATKRLAHLEKDLPRFHSSTEHVEKCREIYAQSIESKSRGSDAMFEFDLDFPVRAHHLTPLWLIGQEMGLLALSPYVTDGPRQIIEDDPRLSSPAIGKQLFNESLEAAGLESGNDVLQAQKVSLPDSLRGAYSELMVWCIGLQPDPEITSVAAAWPEASRVNLGWWSETIRVLREIARQRDFTEE